MSDGSQFIDIVLFAMVAVFLGLRLRSVLGKRTGHEPPPGAFRGGLPPSRDKAERRDKVIEGEVVTVEPTSSAPPGSLAAGLAAVRANDSSFTVDGFKQGAVAAFEMIVRAFAQGEEDALRPLLADDVFASFAGVIQSRRAAGQVSQNEVVRMIDADVVGAQMDGRIARVTVKYVTEQIVVIKDAQGAVVEGDPSRTVEITDLWTFARDTRSRDPNWRLVATSSPEA